MVLFVHFEQDNSIKMAQKDKFVAPKAGMVYYLNLTEINNKE